MAAVPAHTALVEYVKFTRFDFKAVPALGQSQWRETRYAAWFFSGRDEARLFDLGPADRIDNQVDAVRDYIVGAGTLNTESAIGAGPRADRHFAAQPAGAQPACAAFAEDLSDLLLKPLGGELAWRPNLLLSPDGNLTRLSFASLPLAEGGYLLDRYCIGYLSAARDILSFRPEDAVGGPALVVADPDFDLCEDSPCASDVVPANRSSAAIRSGLGRFVRLEGTRQEGEAIARMLGVQPLLGSLALDGTIKSSRAPSILHLATHSFFLADPPSQPRPGVDYGILEHLATLDNPLLRSGIALAGINSWLGGKRLPPSAEDGLLTAEVVACLNLRGTRLAVLSACDTGVGQIQVGEGVFGFRRAFALAGVRTLLMSLWKVPDDHTAELMIAFYERVLNNESCADALRQAQRQLAVKHPHLRSWAAFICQGDPGPL
jgi:CHAT domain-containing protein